MTALPPAGWYPDPQVGGTRWRWWDGYAWAPPSYGYDPAAAALALVTHRKATSRYGNWLRWAMLVNPLSLVVFSVAIALIFRGHAFDTVNNGNSGEPQFSGSFLAFQLVTLPLNAVSFAYVGSLIAWIYHAGKFAEARGWPAVRGRTLGAFSVLIPIVNLWWPYEAVRDSYPPGSSPAILLKWWVSYLVAPIFVLPAFFLGLFGSPVAIAIAIAIGACAVSVPVWLGWQLIRDVEVMQRANSPAAS
jgi:hypothetical protein